MIVINEKNVGTWCHSRRAMEVDRLLGRALRGGTPAMRAMGPILLPMDFRERQSLPDYVARLSRTFLFPAYDEAIGGLAAKPFQRNVTVTDAPPELEPIEMDADREGTNLTTMAQQVLDHMWSTGLGIILVDKPDVRVGAVNGAGEPVVGPDGEQVVTTMTAQQEAEANVRPYFQAIDPDRLIGWSWRMENGRRILEHVRIYEDAWMMQDDGAEVMVQRIRVWTEAEWLVYERLEPKNQPTIGGAAAYSGTVPTIEDAAEKFALLTQSRDQAGGDAYRLVGRGPNPLRKVPLVFRNLRPEGKDPLRAKPPLRGLAWKNLEDWQLESSELNNLHWHSYPVLTGAGMSAEQVQAGIVYGAGASALSTDPAFRMSFVETNGASAAALGAKRETLRSEMQAMGLAPYVEARPSGTATGAAIDDSRGQTQAQFACEMLEWLIFDAYGIAAEWQSATMPESFDIDVFRDFSLGPAAQANLATLDAARGRKDISQETYLRELQRYSVLDRDVDIDEELQRLEDEKPDLTAMGLPPGEAFGQDPNQDPAAPDPANDPAMDPAAVGGHA